MDYITAQTPDKGVQIGPEPPISNDSMAMTPDKGVQIGKELPIIDASTALTPDKGVQIGPELPINNYSIALAPDKGVQVGPEPPISNDSIAMINDTIPGFGGNLIEAGIVLNGTKSAVYKSTAYPANADGTQRPGAVVEYSSEFSVGEGFSVGGAKSDLPSGYLAAAFLENTGSTSNMKTDIVPHNLMGARCIMKSGKYAAGNVYYFFCMKESPGTTTMWIALRPSLFPATAFAGWGIAYRPNGSSSGINGCLFNYKNSRKVGFAGAEDKWLDLPELPFTPTKPLYLGNLPDESGNGHRMYYGELTEGDSVTYIFKPAITDAGEPCFYELKHKKTYKADSVNAFIVGLSLEQALQLSKLPATGGTLTISLPEGYDSDANVMAALETARSKGWTLTIQTYTPENTTEATSTFALRRIWVRKTQDENGGYVDTNGSRWHVDWCVDMLTPDGSTPDAYGYEMFRNVDAAAAYWELTPYVDPDAEKEFSQEL